MPELYTLLYDDIIDINPIPSMPGVLKARTRNGDCAIQLVPQAPGKFAAKHMAYTGFTSLRPSVPQAVFRLPAYIPGAAWVYTYSFGSCSLVADFGSGLYEYQTRHGSRILVNSSGAVVSEPSAYQVYVYCIPFSLIYAVVEALAGVYLVWRDDWDPIVAKRGYMRNYDDLEIISLGEYCRIRTAKRIRRGEYFPVPNGFYADTTTGVHLSTIDDKLLAYYPTNRHILEDRPQRIKPGKYLKKYFSHMTDDEIRVMSAKVGNVKLEFFSRGADMVRLYMKLSDSGVVSSCMSKRNWDPHPLMVYDNSDVELAVLMNDGEPIARALYNKHTREYPMVYGQWERMQVALAKAGFTHGTLNGARLNAIRYKEGYLMPYIDGHRNLNRSVNNSTRVNPDDENHQWVVDEDGVYACNAHDTATIARGFRFRADMDAPVHVTCACCGGELLQEDAIYLPLDHEYLHDSDDCTVNVVRVVTHSGSWQWEYESDEHITVGDYTYSCDSAAENNGMRYSYHHDRWGDMDDMFYCEHIDSWLFDNDRGTLYELIDDEIVHVDVIQTHPVYVDTRRNKLTMYPHDTRCIPLMDYVRNYMTEDDTLYIPPLVQNYIDSQLEISIAA